MNVHDHLDAVLASLDRIDDAPATSAAQDPKAPKIVYYKVVMAGPSGNTEIGTFDSYDKAYFVFRNLQNAYVASPDLPAICHTCHGQCFQCTACSGQGCDVHDMKECPTCHGKGTVPVKLTPMVLTCPPCPKCHGQKRIEMPTGEPAPLDRIFRTCQACRGAGYL